MLNQQRTLLYLIQQFGGKISRLQLTKLCFLLSQELPQETRLKFYQFIPYRRGPFSFCMYQESESLVGNYYLEKVDDRYLQITEYGKLMGLSLSQVFKNQVDNIIQRHGKKTVQELLDYVYDQFPWYTINSIASPRCSRPVAETAIYTVGYEGLVVDSFLDLLLKNGIQCLIDVRQNPISRRYGFYKKTLASFCNLLDIEYNHFPQLGIQSEKRRNLKTVADYHLLFQQYKKTTLIEQREVIANIANIMQDKPSALLSMEANLSSCHRSHLAYAVAKISNLPIQHLDKESCLKKELKESKSLLP